MPIHKLRKSIRWATDPQVCICSTVEVSMGSDAGINHQRLHHQLSPAGAIITVLGQEVGDFPHLLENPRQRILIAALIPSGSFTERRPRAMTSPKFNR